MCHVRPRWHGPRRTFAALLLVSLPLALAFVGCAADAPRPAGPQVAPDRSAGKLHASASDAGAAMVVHPTKPLAAIGLVPAPRTMTACAGSLLLDTRTEIVVDDDPRVKAIGVRLGEWLGVGATRVRAIAAGQPGPARAIVLRLEKGAAVDRARDPAVNPPQDTTEEAYTLDVSAESAVVRARHPAGLFYGAQTVAQLAGSRPLASLLPAPAASRSLPCVHIDDAPAHRLRAMHLDVARHFFDKAVVERYVDLLAFYRYNVFHWHLTDDQGFRLSIASHPELTKIGATRMDGGREHAGAYTQEDAREVVAFAKERFVTVIPEIEMPGHARAILASHPELSCTGKKQDVPSTWGVFEDVLCAGNEGTFALLGDVLRETTEIFPSKIVHLGGDEVPKARWNACPKCRDRMAKEKLGAEQLQGAFMKRAAAMLASHGRRAAAWDEALEGGLPQDGVVFAWRGTERGAVAARAGHDVVMTPADTTYFNYWQSRDVAVHPGHDGDLPWTKVLAFDPVPRGLDAPQRGHVLGGEGTLWTEHVISASDIDALVLPRMAVLSDVLWRAPAPPSDPRALAQAAESFAERFTTQRPMLDQSMVAYFVEPPVGLRPKKVFLEAASVFLAPPAIHPDGVVRYTLDGGDPTATSPIFGAAVELRATSTVSARLFLPGGRKSEIVRGKLERSALHPTIEPSMMASMMREGALYKYFEVPKLEKLPDFAKLGPKATGRVSALGFAPSFRKEQFAVVYDAWIRVPEDGVFRFVARADDGVAVDVDGERVLEDDGAHAPRDADGEIALARGPHTIRVSYFQGGGGKTLVLECEGPGLPRGVCILVSP